MCLGRFKIVVLHYKMGIILKVCNVMNIRKPVPRRDYFWDLMSVRYMYVKLTLDFTKFPVKSIGLLLLKFHVKSIGYFIRISSDVANLLYCFVDEHSKL